jgi:hypothetical protein
MVVIVIMLPDMVLKPATSINTLNNSNETFKKADEAEVSIF